MQEAQYTTQGYTSEHGKSRVKIICPFCGTATIAYIWSISGVGKRCDGCKAKHTSFGVTVKET